MQEKAFQGFRRDVQLLYTLSVEMESDDMKIKRKTIQICRELAQRSKDHCFLESDATKKAVIEHGLNPESVGRVIRELTEIDFFVRITDGLFEFKNEELIWR